MPSVSGAQHRLIGYWHSHPEARPASMSANQVDEWLHSDRGSPWKHATGGGIIARDAGGMLPAAQTMMGGSPETQSPMGQNIYAAYSQMPIEKLREMQVRIPPSTPQGQAIQRVIQAKMMQPQQAQQQPQPSQQSAPSSPGIVAPQGGNGIIASARGGGLPRRAMGGDPMGLSPSMASPWWERSENYAMDARPMSGLLGGSTFGRSDHVTTAVPGGGYVLPADVVAGLGEGNSLAGAAVVDRMLHSGPHGIEMPRIGRGSGPPRQTARAPSMRSFFRAGGVPQDGGGKVPVKLSDGEYFIHPIDVSRIGGGSLKRGHRILDAWVKLERAKHIKKLKALPGPVKAA